MFSDPDCRASQQPHGVTPNNAAARPSQASMMMLGDSDTPAAEIYRLAVAELARLERDAPQHSEWLRFSHDLLEALMRCQAIVMERQRALLEARAASIPIDEREHRASAKEALEFVDRLTTLYQRAKTRLAKR